MKSISKPKSKSSDDYLVVVDDKDYDMIYYDYRERCSTTTSACDEQTFDNQSNDLWLEWQTNSCLKTHSKRLQPIVCLVLGFALLSVLTIVCNKYIFRINISNNLFEKVCNSYAVNDTIYEDNNPLLSVFETAVTVQTECMKIIGNVEENAFAFKGIPYAIPPIGDLRWSRPIPLIKDQNRCNSKENHFKANAFSSDCLQYNSTINQIVGEENCLYLNVWTPIIDDSANLNVMVYIHGGLDEGSAYQPLRPNGQLAQKLNTVFVSINYRLNAFGFLALDMLANTNANASHANYGVWDAMVALQWLTSNIAAFGGNPHRLTLFGANGEIIVSLLASNEFSSYISSAWIVSTKLTAKQSFSLQSKLFRKSFLMRTNCSTVACLLAMDGREVLDIYRQYRHELKDFSLIVFDDEILTSDPNEEMSKTLLLVSSEQTIDCLSDNLSNISSQIYTYSVQKRSIDQNSTNGRLDSNQLLVFFTAIDQNIESYSDNRTTFAEDLHNFVFSFINRKHSSDQTINTTAIACYKC